MDISRRSFIKTTLIGGAGLVYSGSISFRAVTGRNPRETYEREKERQEKR